MGVGGVKRVLIIGGGAAGMMAAISASAKGAKVTIYEHKHELGKKILSTGNGKCNITNRHLDKACYNSCDLNKVEEYFKAFDEEDTISTFKSFGLLIKDNGGYLYPACEQAIAVRDILVSQLKSYEVEIVTDILTEEIVKNKNIFSVKTKKGVREFDNVVLACGSYAGLRKTERIDGDIDGYSLAYHLGHKIIPVKPALTQLICREEYFKDISGVRATCNIRLYKNGELIGEEFGEMQLTEFGVSGIPVFQLSRHVSEDLDADYTLLVDLLPGFDEEEFKFFIKRRILSYQGMSVGKFFLGLLNNKLNALFIRLGGLNADMKIDESNQERVMESAFKLKAWSIGVKRTKSFENSQCCLGGVPLSEIDKTCQSLVTPGLYIVGEMLDVDGRCGGYNLQWAWTTGHIAGSAAGKSF